MAMTSIVLTRGSICPPRKALEIFLDACPVTDWCLNVCFYRTFIGFEKFKKTIYFIEQWGLYNHHKFSSVFPPPTILHLNIANVLMSPYF